MGLCLSLQLVAPRPLSAAARGALRALMQEVAGWDWEQGGIQLELPDPRRADGLVGRALVPVPMDADGDVARVIAAAHRIAGLLPEVSVRVDDDLGMVGTEDGLPVVNGGERPAEMIDEEALEDWDGSWTPLLAPVVLDVPEKLLAALTLLDTPPDPELDPTSRAGKAAAKLRAKAHKTASSAANLGRLLLVLADRDAPADQKTLIHSILRQLDPTDIAVAGTKKHKKLQHDLSRLLAPLTDRLLADFTDGGPLATAFLAVWRRGRSRYHWGDFLHCFPRPLLARIGQDPEIEAQLIADIPEAWEEWDEEAMARRAGAAARVLGLASRPAGARALVEAVRRKDDRGTPGDVGRQTMRGVYEGLGSLVLGPHGDPARAPVATLLRSLGLLGQHDNDSPSHLLPALVRTGDPRAKSLVLYFEDSGQHLRGLAAIRAHADLPWVRAMLLRLAHSTVENTLHEVRRGLHRSERDAPLPPLAPEERAMAASGRRPYPGDKEALLAELTALHRTGDRRYALALVTGANGLGRATWDSDPRVDWADPAGMQLGALEELGTWARIQALDALDLPPQILPPWLQALADEGRLQEGMAERYDQYDLFSRPRRDALRAEEQAWLDALPAAAEA